MMATTSKVITSCETSCLLSKYAIVGARGCFYRMLSSSHGEPTGQTKTTGGRRGGTTGEGGGLSRKDRGTTDRTDPKRKAESSNHPQKNPQEFVKIRFEPGQYDPEMTDPLYRPPWKPRTKVISEEDYVNRPTVGFSEEFASLADARVTFTHMTHETKDKIYQDYLDLMEAMDQREKVTSHEYAVTVIARKYSIMPDRAAAIIQLKHNEERIKVDFPDRKIHYEFAKKMDDAISKCIREIYAQYDEVPPTDFVEEAWEYTGKGSRQNVQVDDLLDLDELSRQAIAREREHAQKLIDTKVYKEDYDSSLVEVKVNQECQKLMKAHDEMKRLMSTYGNTISDAVANQQLTQKDTGVGDASKKTVVKVVERKPSRSVKFVAHAINTAEARKKKSHRKNKDQSSLIVEQNGHLRAPTEEEVQSTSWKSQRYVKEFILKGVKKGWLDKKQKGITTAWGRAPTPETVADQA